MIAHLRRIGVLLGLVLASRVTGAQLPDRFVNLQVLPSDISSDSLLVVMGGFTRALGVRCAHCHVARNAVRPAADEFASDEREQKRVARVMLRMVADINGRHLPATGRDVRALTSVTCSTCHRGLPRPVPLETELLRTYERVGIDSTIAQYRALRIRYFGSAAYDFSDVALPTLADRLASIESRRIDALSILKLNLEFHPDSWFGYQQLGQLQAVMGDTTEAIRSIERGLAINPERSFLRDMLARLRKR